MLEEKKIMSSWDKKYNNDPIVTIWCTVFNHEKYIAQCLEGFLMQITTFPFIVIVHDDASSDQSAKIIQKYANKYPNIIKPVIEECNVFSQGKIAFGNRMVKYLKTIYIARCEGDDFWNDPHKLQKQFDFLITHPEYIAVGHLVKSIDNEGNMIRTFIDSKPGNYTCEDTETWQLFAHVSSYFYKNIFLDLSIEEREHFFSVPVPGDRKYPILFLKYGKLFVMKEEMSVYRFMSCPTSYTSQVMNRQYYNIYLEYKEVEKYAKDIGITVDYRTLKKKMLYTSFYEFFYHRDDSLIWILKERKKMAFDLISCLVHFLIRMPRYLKNRFSKNTVNIQ